MLALIWQPNEHKVVRVPELDASFKTSSQGSLEEAVSAAAHDGRMRNLFALFDADLDNKINFKDIAMSLRKIAPHVRASALAFLRSHCLPLWKSATMPHLETQTCGLVVASPLDTAASRTGRM